MKEIIDTVEAAIKTEQGSIDYYTKKITDDTALYNDLIQKAKTKKENLEKELKQLKQQLKSEVISE